MQGQSRSRFETVDPAPALGAPQVHVGSTADLEQKLLDAKSPMFLRMRALFSLRNMETDEAVDSLGQCLLKDGSALLRHEAAYVLGQLQNPRAIPALADALANDPNPMVRHESAESLGNMPEDRRPLVRPHLERAFATDTSVEVRESCEVALANLDFLDNPKEFEY
ncbi:MAG: HEAT repeat domain-containing protein [Thermoplasmatota archaeon]